MISTKEKGRELGYKDHGYNEFTFEMNKILLTFWFQMIFFGPKWQVTKHILTVISNHVYNEHFWLVAETSL